MGEDTAAARAEYFNNTFEVETSCVARLAINLHPAMIDFSQPVKIVVNGTEVFNHTISLDKNLVAKGFNENADRALMWGNKLSIEVKK